MWKPGQIVTINNTRYRVKRSNTGLVICERQCDMWLDDNPEHLTHERKICQKICLSINCQMLLGSCYLKRIKPKSSIG